MAMPMRWYSSKRIDWCAMLSASIEAIESHNWLSIHSVLPQQPPWSHTNKQMSPIKINASNLLIILMAIAMRRYGTERINRASCPALQLKPVDTKISRIFAPYCPGDRQGPIQASKRTQSNDKTNTQTYIAQAKKRQMDCLLYFPRANFAPKIDGHTNSAFKYHCQVNNLHSL